MARHYRAVAAGRRSCGRTARVTHRSARCRHRSLARLTLPAARGAELHKRGSTAAVTAAHAAAAAGGRREGGEAERQTNKAHHDELLQRANSPSDERDHTSGGAAATTENLAHESAPGVGSAEKFPGRGSALACGDDSAVSRPACCPAHQPAHRQYRVLESFRCDHNFERDR